MFSHLKCFILKIQKNYECSLFRKFNFNANCITEGVSVLDAV